MKQSDLIKYECIVKGVKIKEGDVIFVHYGGNITIHKVIIVNGTACVKDHYIHGENAKIASLTRDSWAYIKKATPKDVYVFCKKNQLESEKYLKMFK